MSKDAEYMTVSLRLLMDHCNDWCELCGDLGLNSWCMAEGLTDSADTMSVSVDVLRKHGIFRSLDRSKEEA